MFAKRLLQKVINHHHQKDTQHGNLKPEDLEPQILFHYGVPYTASILAVDPIQQLLAIGTLDGRIKVIGEDNIEGLLISPKQLPYKYLEFLQNQGYLVGILNDNEIQVWNLESRSIAYSLQWGPNITAFSVISGSLFMLVGDEYGSVSVLKYTAEDGKLIDMPYRISPDCIAEKTGISFPSNQSVVGVLPQPSGFGDRLLIAYQYGLLILWDVVVAEVVVFKGDKDLLIKGQFSNSPHKVDADLLDNAHEDMNEKEISSLCWASSFGSTLAVGYIDGDILLWNLPRSTSAKCKNIGISCKDVVKLQLSSAGNRLPVVMLRWCESTVSQHSCEGQLFVYGGCESGSDEVITIVSLQWSPGMETLKGVRRLDLALNAAFADMVSLSSLETAAKSHHNGLFVLTAPGKLQFYPLKNLSALAAQPERKSSASGIQSPIVVPTSDPQMTAAKLSLQPCDVNMLTWLSEMASIVSTLSLAEGTKWPLTGGIRSEISSAEEEKQKRIYIAGYQDGSVRIWDATSPIFSLVSILEGQVHGIENAGSNNSVTILDFCALLMTLAVGTECGEVRIYSLRNDARETKLHWVTDSERKVCDVPPRGGPHCRAIFSLVNSPVRSLHFSASGAKLAVGFQTNHVAVIDIISLSVLFLTDSVASSKSVISVILKEFSDDYDFSKGLKHVGPKIAEQHAVELMFTLTQDAKVNILDSNTGSPITLRPLHTKKEHTAISMYVLEGSHFTSVSSSEQHEQSNMETTIPSEIQQNVSLQIDDPRGNGHPCIDGERFMDSLLLLCCQNVLRLYQLKSILQGEEKPTHKVKLGKTCCWTSILMKDDIIGGLILVYESGIIEVRSLPRLELLTESSLMSLVRWNFRPNMEKLASSTDNGQICLINASELYVFSLSTGDEKRFLNSLPVLHDKVVAAAADAAFSYYLKQKKPVAAAATLGGVVKGFRKETSSPALDTSPVYNFLQLEDIFSRPVFPESSVTTVGNREEEELDIDDIEIDEPVLAASSSSNQVKAETTEKQRERLFEGIPMDAKPRSRTPEEIMAAYRGTEYASAAAERARNKLLERQDKLEKINQRTEDLRNEAEDFASMANELVKTMERKKKWWKI